MPQHGVLGRSIPEAGDWTEEQVLRVLKDALPNASVLCFIFLEKKNSTGSNTSNKDFTQYPLLGNFLYILI